MSYFRSRVRPMPKGKWHVSLVAPDGVFYGLGDTGEVAVEQAFKVALFASKQVKTIEEAGKLLARFRGLR